MIYSEITFNEFVQGKKITDTRRGDFIADAKADKHLPSIENWKQLKRYLSGKHPDVIDAAYSAWRGYLDMRRKQQRQRIFLLLLWAIY